MGLFSERRGQVEIAALDHNGHVFAAFVSSVSSRHVTAYTRKRHGIITLTRWDGSKLFGCRTNTVREYHDGSLALLIRLTHRRVIVGYALGDGGMLFRVSRRQIHQSRHRHPTKRVTPHA
jgi:hypothetical protein